MADGEYTGPVGVKPTTTGLDISSADFLPLDDSTSSNAQDSPRDARDEQDDDSASDVSMAPETDDEADPDPPNPPSQDNQPDSPVPDPKSSPSYDHDVVDNNATKKRKSFADHSLESVKKVKRDQKDNIRSIFDKPALPAEIWHHIFTFCPPRTLGKLLLVNRHFHSYLDSSSTIRCDPPSPLSSGTLSLVKPNFIWQASRRRFWPTMPTPLQGKTELDMWRFSCATCQHCNKPSTAQKKDHAEPGPGKDGISIIWAFATRSCGPCLLGNSKKVCSFLYI